MMTGHALIARINALMMEELDFRQSLAANPNEPNAVVRGTRIQNMAVALNQDIAAYNQALAAVTPDIRPFVAQNLSTFDSLYWTPAMQRFACYNTQFQQNASTIYQPLYASMSWLQCWMTNYQTSLNTIAMAPQTYACARWWCGGPMVLGSTQQYPYCASCGNNFAQANLMVLPNGQTVYVPAGAMPFASTCGGGTCPTCSSPCPTCAASQTSTCPTCGMGMTICPITPAAAPAPATTPPAPIPPVTRGAD
jgi:hypothetical protein